MNRSFQPRKGDRAKIVSNVPAQRYVNRWATVVRGSSDGLVKIQFPLSHRLSPMTVNAHDLLFYRGGVEFTV